MLYSRREYCPSSPWLTKPTATAGRTRPRGTVPQNSGAARDRPRGIAAGVQNVLHGDGSPPRCQQVHTHEQVRSTGRFENLSRPKIVEPHDGKWYALIVRDDFSRCTWIYLLCHNLNAVGMFKMLVQTVSFHKW